jgi:SAM-dependent methyltransferase
MDSASDAIDAQRQAYRALFLEHGRSEEALCWSKNKQAIRFSALTRFLPDQAASLLDYGCGLGDLRPWLAEHRPNFRYTGVDIVEEFIASNRDHFGTDAFKAIGGPADVPDSFDLVVLSGVFNLRTLDQAAHDVLIESTLASLFEKTRVALAVDFLSTDVDFRHQAGHHQDIGAMADFMSRRLSRRLVVDKSYLPYEYCITVWKDAEIERPRNVYRHEVPRHG